VLLGVDDRRRRRRPPAAPSPSAPGGVLRRRGNAVVQSGEETIDAEAGAFVFIPPGVVHAFSNRSDAPARCVNAYVPGGIEGFFVEVGEAMAGGQPDPAEIDRLSAKYDVYFTEG
jgi:hypothetical protein